MKRQEEESQYENWEDEARYKLKAIMAGFLRDFLIHKDPWECADQAIVEIFSLFERKIRKGPEIIVFPLPISHRESQKKDHSPRKHLAL